MARPLNDERIAAEAAGLVHDAFGRYQADFLEVTGRAAGRFAARDWRGVQGDSKERLDLYGAKVRDLVAAFQVRLGDRLTDTELWGRMKRIYSDRIAERPNRELAQTFFNSSTRRVFDTVGVRPDVEFVSLHSAPPDWHGDPALYRSYDAGGDTRQLVREILRDHPAGAPYRDPDEDAAEAARRIDRALAEDPDGATIDRVETLRPLFYRNKGAYIMGRIRSGDRFIPLLLPFVHTDRGVELDAVLTDENDASVVFSFTRSHFFVDTESPGELIGFLRSILPLKPVAELYNSLGFNKHSKTELYRDLRSHLQRTHDLFEPATGDEGMVMLVFTLPSYDVVFKVIKDRFAYPKTNTRDDVMNRYRMVFQHDRVGRLVDAQEFEHLTFRRERFATGLLAQLRKHAARTVDVGEYEVHVKHLYTERKVTPLNLYVRNADDGPAREAVIDYGNAIKELAAADIFPGDFLLKNFGVTRHGRVVFYDYDELCHLADCRFRRFPPARSPEDEMQAEPWFSVAENDVFPEEFRKFLGMPTALRACFVEHHSDLFDPAFWTDLQARHAAGEILDVFPYPLERRLRPGPVDGMVPRQ